ncbi:hypothetical protein K2173_018181 [Erythroxylum novogranatense]|uniref:Pentatricopeptide repeat-containing protein n=1 Tax=Erythroxylum novogranatense TaxID=1862640 RepID=A0AAV8TLJ4_9ROSI|nr:hypothetical protein K2173_018181 [Erythroxylum novogranatense]
MTCLPPFLSPTKPTKDLTQFGSLVLQPCLSLLELCKYTNEFEQLQAKLIKLGLIHNSLAFTRLLCYSSISEHSDMGYAQSIFNHDKYPNAFSYNVMIRGYTQKDEPEAALSLFDRMLSHANCLPNNLTFPFVLKACAQAKASSEGKQVHGQVIKRGLNDDLYVNNSLISMYSSSGLIGYARLVFDKMDAPDVVSWNSIIKGLIDSGLVEDGKSFFDRMPVTNIVTWNCLIDGYVKVGLLKEARELFDHMGRKDSVSWNSIIGGYVSAGLIEDARELFSEMPQEMKDIISFNLMIGGYARQSRHKEVLESFNEMQVAEIEPNRFTLVSGLTACSYLMALDQGEWLHDYIEKNSIKTDAIIGTALISMYAKCGRIDKALSMFESMEDKDVGAWNSIIHGLGIHGNGEEALEVFSDMVKSNVSPDDVTFLGLLSACRHSGLVNEGKRCFQIMVERYGLAPKIEHYGCMVDLLCRADLLDEARDLIETSQMKQSVPLWGALLGASCRLGNLEMGEYASKHLMELDPLDCSCHIVLSNMYSSAGFHKKAIEIRNKMRDKGLEKVPGSSSMEIDGLIKEFRVSDYLECI